MPPSSLARIAIVADVHYHDVYGNYGVEGIFDDKGRRLTVRLLADTVKSTRVFNESYQALRRTLDDIAAAGIRDVVLLGDYSDDGQVATVKSLRLLLDDYERKHGLRFHALPGNHDIFALDGRHRTKRFLTSNGGYSVATSDAAVRDDGAAEIVVTPLMYCPGYPEGLSEMAAFGFFPRGDELHWETPFGTSPAVEDRCYEVSSPDGRTRRRLMEASYLIEPVAGVWLLMIDANVFAPVDGVEPGHDGDFADSTDAGWNGMLRHKAFLFDWFADVARRAEAGGKCLMAFSHYPAIDPLDGTRDEELALLGRTGMVKRIPDTDVAARLMAAGITVHFSGHLHVNDTASVRGKDGYLVNVAVPSLVAFPCGYKVVTVHSDRLEIDTPRIDDLVRDADIRRCYELEIGASPSPPRGEGARRAEEGVSPLASSQPSPSSGPAGHLLPAGEKGKQGAGWEAKKSLAKVQATDDYGTFLYEHLGHLIGRRHLKREWPKALGDALRVLNLADLVALAQLLEGVALTNAKAVAASLAADQAQAGDIVAESRRLGLSAMDFLADWYRLRMGSELALPWVGAEKLVLYDAIAALYHEASWPADTAQAAFALLFAMYERYRSGLASNRFSIRRADGAISDQS